MIKPKIIAATIHLSIGLLISIPILTYVLLVWYPSPIFEVSGLKKILYIFLLTDLILGPLLTFLIFKPSKKNLKIDLTVIALFQITAFFYGMYTIYLGHPTYIVYTVDRFTLVTPQDIFSSRPNKISLDSLGYPVFVYAKNPENPQEKQKIALEVLAGLPDIDQRPEYYLDFNENISSVFNSGIPLDKIIRNNITKQKLEKFLTNKNFSKNNYVFLPLSGKYFDLIWVWDRLNKSSVGFIDIDPWSL